METKRITDLFGTSLPIIQAGMVWVSGAKLAAASAEAGALGIVGAGSLKPDLLREHLTKVKTLTDKPVAVNVPLLYEKTKEQIDTALECGIRIFFTAAGSPKLYTSYLKDQGAIVVHVTSSPKLAKKCEDAGVDAIVAEGFEAGGHNGRDEITTMALIPQVVDTVKIPVIAAGGIADGRGIAAAFALGAAGVQIGSRFAITQESSGHKGFRQAVVDAGEDGTMLTMRRSVPVRLLRNRFYEQLSELEQTGKSYEEMKTFSKGRARQGIFEGDATDGAIEIGQVSAMIRDIPTVAELVDRMKREYEDAVSRIPPSLSGN